MSEESMFGPHARYKPGSAEYDRQTAVMDSLPHACTVGRMDANWRKAADELVRLLSTTEASMWWPSMPTDQPHAESCECDECVSDETLRWVEGLNG